MRRLPVVVAASLVAAAGGCDGDTAEDARTPRTVAVPDADTTPPSVSVELELRDGTVAARATQPGEAPAEAVRLEWRSVRGTVVGTDADSGAPRVRVAIHELIGCRLPGGRIVERPKVSYFPPSQVERIRSSPGARIPARARRSVQLGLGNGRCPAGARAVSVEGELWGDVTNGMGLEAVTPHIRFRWGLTL